MKILAGFLALVASMSASAYGCSKPKTVASAVEQKHEIVLKGTVADIEVWNEKLVAVSFDVETVYHGDLTKHITILFETVHDPSLANWNHGTTFLISARPGTISGMPTRPSKLIKLGPNLIGNMCTLRKKVRQRGA